MNKKQDTSNIILFIIIALLLIAIGVQNTERALAVSVAPTDCDGYLIVESNESDSSTEYLEFSVVQTEDRDELINLMKTCKSNMEAARRMADCARELGYGENHLMIEHAKYCYTENQKNYEYYKSVYDSLTDTYKTDTEQEYESATKIWNYLKECGYSDVVSAGIMGNMMAECGGNSLNLIWNIYGGNGGYYGICQWSGKYCKSVFGKDIIGQCQYLSDTIENEFNTFGYVYYKGFNYESFLVLDDECKAALAFAKCYERCTSVSYKLRQKCATEAYNYFVNK